MRIYQSNVQRERAKYPDQLDFDQVALNRHLLKTKEEKDRYQRLLAGAKGEQLVLKYLERYGVKDWSVILNLWLNHNGAFETDLILITRDRMYCFEIKNYTGEFTYENGISKMNGWELDSNPIEQKRRSSVKMKNIMRDYPYHAPIEHAVIFTNANNYVQILSDVGEIKIVPRYRLLNFIKEIVKNERHSASAPLETKQILNHLQVYEIINPFTPKPLSKNERPAAKKGIYCRKCLSYAVEIRRTKVICTCGFIEAKEEATLRTICDYGVLNFGGNLTIKELFIFFDGQVGETYLTRILYKHFAVTKNGRHTFFHNLMLSYPRNEQNFKT